MNEPGLSAARYALRGFSRDGSKLKRVLHDWSVSPRVGRMLALSNSFIRDARLRLPSRALKAPARHARAF
jgi:hypothetical protein